MKLPAQPPNKEAYVVNAALAGTPLFKTLATSDTKMKHGYIFLIKYNENDVLLDAILDISEIMLIDWIGRITVQKLTGEIDLELNALYHAISMMGIRAKMDGSIKGPYLIRSPAPIPSKILQTLLSAKPREELNEFLKTIKV
jgi:hypothetical protein